MLSKERRSTATSGDRFPHGTTGRRLAAIRRLAVLGLAAVGLCFSTATAQAQTGVAPTDCGGYAEKRVFLESQSGWWPAGTSTYGAAEHVHSGTCFPYLQTLEGAVPFKIRSTLHNNPTPGRLDLVRVQVYNSQVGTKTLAYSSERRTCDGSDCEFWTTLSANTALLPYDGMYEFRVQTETRSPDGAKHRATNGWLAYVRNGKPSSSASFSGQRTEGRGWYSLPSGQVLGYENARLVSPVPTSPVSGVWTPRIRTLVGSGGETIQRTFASVDPRFHAVPEDSGLVAFDGPLPYDGTVKIDTTRLTNGPHKLLIRADANEPNSTKLSGAVVVPFEVQN